MKYVITFILGAVCGIAAFIFKYDGIRKKKMARWVERIKKAGGSHAR